MSSFDKRGEGRPAGKSFGERKYWVFEELNTKPGVTYLQKVTRDTMSGGPA